MFGEPDPIYTGLFVHVPYVTEFLHELFCVCPATATDRLILQEQAERKEKPPSTSAHWKQLLSKQQLFTFPAYWMSNGGRCSFADCINNRWTSRSALRLRNGRNVKCTMDTDDISWAAAAAAQELSTCRYLLLRLPSGCVCMRLCQDLWQSVSLLYMRVCDVSAWVCVFQQGGLCGPAMWKEFPSDP